MRFNKIVVDVEKMLGNLQNHVQKIDTDFQVKKSI